MDLDAQDADDLLDLFPIIEYNQTAKQEMTSRFRKMFELFLVRSNDGGDSDLSSLPQSRILALSLSWMRSKTYESSNTWAAANYGDLHIDYLENHRYVYTAILCDEPTDDLVGGETVLVDDMDGLRYSQEKRYDNRQLIRIHDDDGDNNNKDNWIVEPQKGRLVLFTSGAENPHAPLQVLEGQRPTYHIWFECINGF